jgi:hypothetical protein
VLGYATNSITIHCREQGRQSARRFLSRPNRDSPTPSPAGECVPPPLVQGGGVHISLVGEGMGGGPNSDERTDIVVL